MSITYKCKIYEGCKNAGEQDTCFNKVVIGPKDCGFYWGREEESLREPYSLKYPNGPKVRTLLAPGI
ncbi:MAG: hypothetical protein ABH817_01000 [archaeon]